MGFISGMFLKIVCILQLRCSVSVVGFLFQSISGSFGVGFFNSVQFEVSVQFQVSIPVQFSFR